MKSNNFPELKQKQRIFVRKGGGLGDVLGIIPLLYVLRRRFPEHELTVAAPERWLPLFKFSQVNRLLAEEKLMLWRLGSSPEKQRELTEFLSVYSKIYWFSFPRGDWCLTLKKYLGGRVRCLSPIPGSDLAVPYYQYCGKILDPPVDRDELKTLPDVLIDCRKAVAGEGGLSTDRKRLICHVGSGAPEKRWPIDRFKQVFNRLISKMDVEIHILVGPAEKDLLMFLDIKNEVIVHSQLSLEQVAALLAQGDAYLGNDSGISHLAGLCGVPGCVFFGPSNSAIWKPWGNSLDVIPFGMSPDDVAARLHHILSR